jgi:streptogramin lyase
VAESQALLVHAAVVIRPSHPIFILLTLCACGDDGPASTPDSTGTSTTGAPEGSSTSSSTGVDGESSSSAGASTGGSSSSSSTDDGESSSTGAPVDSGLELLVCSFSADAVHRFDLDDGSYLGDLGPTEALDGALGIVVGPDGDIYVASEESNQVLRFSGSDGSFVAAFVTDDPRTPDDETSGLAGPGAVLFGADGALYVSSFDSDAILRYDGSTGAFVDLFVPSGAGGLNGPDAGMVFGPDGALYVPGYYSDSIPRFDGRSGEPLGDFTPTDMLDAPRTVVFEGDRLYVANEGSDEVLRFDAATGDFVDVFVEAGAGGLDAPGGMVFDPDGVLHVASVNGNTVLRFDQDGAPLPTLVDAAAAGIDAPTHITLAPALDG